MPTAVPWLQGVPHPGLPRHLEVRRVLAVHEAGSGIVAAVLRQRTGRLEAVEKMSLKARTRWAGWHFCGVCLCCRVIWPGTHRGVTAHCFTMDVNHTPGIGRALVTPWKIGLPALLLGLCAAVLQGDPAVAPLTWCCAVLGCSPFFFACCMWAAPLALTSLDSRQGKKQPVHGMLWLAAHASRLGCLSLQWLVADRLCARH